MNEFRRAARQKLFSCAVAVLFNFAIELCVQKLSQSVSFTVPPRAHPSTGSHPAPPLPFNHKYRVLAPGGALSSFNCRK